MVICSRIEPSAWAQAFPLIRQLRTALDEAEFLQRVRRQSHGGYELVGAYRDASLPQMQKFVDVFCFDEKFRSPELAKERSDRALAHPEHLANFVAGIGKPRRGTASEDEIASIQARTRIVHGRDDRVVVFENGVKLLGLIPDSTLVAFNQCGHWAQVEKAEQFNRLLDIHLDDLLVP